jgi:hypothetical protein
MRGPSLCGATIKRIIILLRKDLTVWWPIQSGVIFLGRQIFLFWPPRAQAIALCSLLMVKEGRDWGFG